MLHRDIFKKALYPVYLIIFIFLMCMSAFADENDIFKGIYNYAGNTMKNITAYLPADNKSEFTTKIVNKGLDSNPVYFVFTFKDYKDKYFMQYNLYVIPDYDNESNNSFHCVLSMVDVDNPDNFIKIKNFECTELFKDEDKNNKTR